MFVPSPTKFVAILAVSTAVFASGSSFAADVESVQIPLEITLTDIRATDAPLYISVQNKAEYRSMKGQGAILKKTDAGTITKTVNLPSEGDYAVSIWHDLDNDGRFSMNERYEIQDGWAMSGTLPAGSAPTFEDAKLTVPSFGTQTTLSMIYPATE